MKFVSRHCFLPVGNAMKIQTSWLSIGLCFDKSHKLSIKSHIWLPPLTPSLPHLMHLAFQVCMISVLLCDPIECVLFSCSLNSQLSSFLKVQCMGAHPHLKVSASVCHCRFHFGFSTCLILSVADAVKQYFLVACQWVFYLDACLCAAPALGYRHSSLLFPY